MENFTITNLKGITRYAYLLFASRLVQAALLKKLTRPKKIYKRVHVRKLGSGAKLGRPRMRAEYNHRLSVWISPAECELFKTIGKGSMASGIHALAAIGLKHLPNKKELHEPTPNEPIAPSPTTNPTDQVGNMGVVENVEISGRGSDVGEADPAG